MKNCYCSINLPGVFSHITRLNTVEGKAWEREARLKDKPIYTTCLPKIQSVDFVIEKLRSEISLSNYQLQSIKNNPQGVIDVFINIITHSFAIHN